MTEIWLIRHGMTEGNRYQRYIGKTDELLCEEGKEKLKEFFYPEPEAVFVSPLVRCRETAEILFPEKKLRIIDQLAESVTLETLRIKTIWNYPEIRIIRPG